MSDLSDGDIGRAWRRNAAPWTAAVRSGRIESRQLATNQAMIEAILSRSPRNVLDLGCGEGWLARALSVRGVHVRGVDIVPELIEHARAAGGGEFHVASYQELPARLAGERVDVLACNFSLFGKDSTEQLFRNAPALLRPGGCLVIQTLHPLMACGDLPYVDGWREGNWDGCGPDFSDPPPWYFRTLENWVRLFDDYGFQLMEMREPLHPHTWKPASVIFVATLMD